LPATISTRETVSEVWLAVNARLPSGRRTRSRGLRCSALITWPGDLEAEIITIPIKLVRIEQQKSLRDQNVCARVDSILFNLMTVNCWWKMIPLRDSQKIRRAGVCVGVAAQRISVTSFLSK